MIQNHKGEIGDDLYGIWLVENAFKTNSARTIGLFNNSEHKVVKINVLHNLQTNVIKTIGFTTFPAIMLLNHWLYNFSKKNVAKTSSCTTCPKSILLKQTVLQHFQK